MTIKRWTDEMVDELASSVHEMREGMNEMREGMNEMRKSMTEMRESMGEMRESMTEMRESITEVRDSVDGLRITTQALLQIATQHQQEIQSIKQRQAENDERFNILLEEVRYLIRGKQEN